jgi:hypothetical protein
MTAMGRHSVVCLDRSAWDDAVILGSSHGAREVAWRELLGHRASRIEVKGSG